MDNYAHFPHKMLGFTPISVKWALGTEIEYDTEADTLKMPARSATNALKTQRQIVEGKTLRIETELFLSISFKTL